MSANAMTKKSPTTQARDKERDVFMKVLSSERKRKGSRKNRISDKQSSYRHNPDELRMALSGSSAVEFCSYLSGISRPESFSSLEHQNVGTSIRGKRGAYVTASSQ